MWSDIEDEDGAQVPRKCRHTVTSCRPGIRAAIASVPMRASAVGPTTCRLLPSGNTELGTSRVKCAGGRVRSAQSPFVCAPRLFARGGFGSCRWLRLLRSIEGHDMPQMPTWRACPA